MLKFVNKLFSASRKNTIKRYSPLVEKINSLEKDITSLSDQELKEKTAYFKNLLSEGNNLDSILCEAFAVVREASKRVLGMRHFDVQILGGLALNEGNIAEMRTGEGKTLVATLPAYLNAIDNQKVHIVTVNDYLAKRDASWMGKVYNFLGLSIGYLQNNDSYILEFDKSGNPTPCLLYTSPSPRD